MTSASPGGMAGAEHPGLGENSSQGCQEQHLLEMQQGHPKDLQGNQSGQGWSEHWRGVLGHPSQSMLKMLQCFKCWKQVLGGFCKDPNILLFPDLLSF